MIGKRALLQTFFVAASALFCGKAQAQSDAFFNSDAPSEKIIRQIDNLKKSPEDMRALTPRTGILFIRGPEYDTSEYKEAAMIETVNFARTFKKYPHRIVGDGYETISIKKILKRLDELAKEDIDDIIIVNFMHGNTDYDYLAATDTSESFTTENSLMYTSKGDLFSADSLYGAIGKRFKTNKNLHDKHLLVVHQSCHGEAALNAFHFLPRGTKIFYYADLNTNAFYMPSDNNFSVAFHDVRKEAPTRSKAKPFLTAQSAFATAFYAANAGLIGERNDIRVVEITAERADTLSMGDKEFFFGDHAGRIVHPSAIAASVLKEFDENQILTDLAEYGDVVPPETMLQTMRDYKKVTRKCGAQDVDVKTQDCLNFIVTAMALKHPEFLENTLSYAAENHVIGFVTKPPLQNYFLPNLFGEATQSFCKMPKDRCLGLVQ